LTGSWHWLAFLTKDCLCEHQNVVIGHFLLNFFVVFSKIQVFLQDQLMHILLDRIKVNDEDKSSKFRWKDKFGKIKFKYRNRIMLKKRWLLSKYLTKKFQSNV
jgi:hypothetical protein